MKTVKMADSCWYAVWPLGRWREFLLQEATTRFTVIERGMRQLNLTNEDIVDRTEVRGTTRHWWVVEVFPAAASGYVYAPSGLHGGYAKAKWADGQRPSKSPTCVC